MNLYKLPSKQLSEIDDLQERIAFRKKCRRIIIRNITVETIFEEKVLIGLAIVCLIFPVLSFGFLNISSGFLHSVRQIVNNICYSYIAGLIFYYLSVKLPVAKQTYIAKNVLHTSYRSINTDLSIAINKLCGSEDGQISEEEKEIAIKTITNATVDDDHVILNDDALKGILPFIRLAQNEAEEKLCYLSSLNDQEKKDLFSVIHILDKLLLSSDVSNNLSTQHVIQKADVEYFISNLSSVSNIMLRRKDEYKDYQY